MRSMPVCTKRRCIERRSASPRRRSYERLRLENSGYAKTRLHFFACVLYTIKVCMWIHHASAICQNHIMYFMFYVSLFSRIPEIGTHAHNHCFCRSDALIPSGFHSNVRKSAFVFVPQLQIYQSANNKRFFFPQQPNGNLFVREESRNLWMRIQIRTVTYLSIIYS